MEIVYYITGVTAMTKIDYHAAEKKHAPHGRGMLMQIVSWSRHYSRSLNRASAGSWQMKWAMRIWLNLPFSSKS